MQKEYRILRTSTFGMLIVSIATMFTIRNGLLPTYIILMPTSLAILFAVMWIIKENQWRNSQLKS